MKKFLSVILILILNTPLLPFFNSSLAYDNKDISALQKIYNHNITVLNHWDLSNPDEIEEVEWKCINDIYRLVSMDLGGIDISGKIDLSEFEYIKYYKFSNTSINEIILPECLNSIPQHAFYSCSNLEYINIPQSINSIEKSSFKNCSNLKSVVLNNSNTSISSETFSGCISLECIVNSNNITYVGRNAFFNCNNLVFYDNDAPNTYINNYIQKLNYPFSNYENSGLTGYATIITGNQESDNYKYPYKFGIAYLYDENNNLLQQTNLNNDGKFSFNNLSIGYKYKLVIDGKFAIARDYYFILTQRDFTISTKEKAFSIIACDFNSDGIISQTDIKSFFQGMDNPLSEDAYLYDINGDGYINISDTSLLYSIINYSDKIIYKTQG